MKRLVKVLLVIGIVLAGASVASAQNGPRGQLKAGAAKVDITPDPESLPKTSYGILDHCHARVILFTNGYTTAGFVNVDAAAVNRRLISEINARALAEYGIPAQNLMYYGTHTHSGGSVPIDEQIERVWGAFQKAYAGMVPAKVGFGKGESHLNVKRDLFDAERGTWWEGPDYDGKSDKDVDVVYFESLEGKPIAVFFNYAMHAVITGNLDMVSGDFAGAASTYVESRYGDDFVASYAVGCNGDQNPIYFQQTFDLRDIRIADYAARGEDISNKMPPGGQGMDRNNPEVQRLMNEQKRMSSSFGQLLGEEVKYVIMMMRHFESNVTINCDTKQVQVPGRRQLNGGGRAGYAGEYEDTDPINLSMGLIMLDDIPFAGVGGEPYCPVALRLKRESPYARIVFSCMLNGEMGYIPDDESYGNQTFEVLGSRYKPGYAETAIVEGILEMIHKATH